MLAGKKVIGVCMTKIHSTYRSKTISYIQSEAEKYGYKLIIFNSAFDFYKGSDDDIGAAGIYDFINYDIVDALIIFCSGILDKSICEKIIENAKRHSTPVILEDDVNDYCYTIRNNYEPSLQELISHVIKVHGVRDTFFMAGVPGNTYSNNRVQVYKRALEANGLEFSEDTVGYGHFWGKPAAEETERLFNTREKMPEAIFCANDAMAIAVCDKIKEHGLRVPEDIIVTGLDGIPMSELSEPRLSTCVADHQNFAKLCFQTISELIDDNSHEVASGKASSKSVKMCTSGKPARIQSNPYSIRYTASCGCKDEEKMHFKNTASTYHNLYMNAMGSETVIFNKLFLMLNSGIIDANRIYSVLPSILTGDSHVVMDPEFITSGINGFTGDELSEEHKKLIVMASGGDSPELAKDKVVFDREDMFPLKEEWAQEDTVYVINAIQVGKRVCGYYEYKMRDAVNESHTINRILNMINMVIHLAFADMRSKIMKINYASSSLINSVTELPSLRAITNWYDEYISVEDNHRKPMSVSLYQFPKYKFIYEKYGVEEVERVLCFVAEALKIANPAHCMIGHIAEDEFAVINPFESVDEIGPEIDRAVAVFYGIMGNYNRTSGKEFNVDIIAGCTYRNELGDTKLEQMIKEATDIAFESRKKYGFLPATKQDRRIAKKTYELFRALVSKNLFEYHFQPIIKVATGEIYAYEALMRTDNSIGLNPAEILDIAREYQMLYSIEKATVFNVIERYVKHMDAFVGRKVFINCIPGYFLNDEDNKKLTDKYGEYIDNFVFEITEEDSIDEEELDRIRRIGNYCGHNAIAVDDYGVGHSNIINLIKYKPEIVKIDRFLITDIHIDITKQLVVKNVIDIAKLNNIKVLAEGVETAQELEKVVALGVDFIQGYFTGRPAERPITRLTDEVAKAIFKAKIEK